MPAGLVLAGSALAGLGSAVASFLGQKSANETNMEMFNRSLEFQKYQYEDSKKYNSAYEQVRRLRAAGINPAFALGTMGAGQVSAGSAPSGNPQQPVGIGDLGGLFSGLLNDAAQRELITSQVHKTNTETEGLGIDNVFKNEDWISKLYNRDSDSALNDELIKIRKLDAQYLGASMKNRLLKLEYETQYQDALLTAQDIANQYLPTQLAEGCAEIISRQFANYATGRSSLKSAQAAIMQAMNQRHAFDAQYGGNPGDRAKFFNATLDNLLQLRDIRYSEEYKNVSSRNFLPITNTSWKQYNEWRDNKNDKKNKTYHW